MRPLIMLIVAFALCSCAPEPYTPGWMAEHPEADHIGQAAKNIANERVACEASGNSLSPVCQAYLSDSATFRAVITAENRDADTDSAPQFVMPSPRYVAPAPARPRPQITTCLPAGYGRVACVTGP